MRNCYLLTVGNRGVFRAGAHRGRFLPLWGGVWHCLLRMTRHLQYCSVYAFRWQGRPARGGLNIMATWHDVFHRPAKGTVQEWLTALAGRLLNGVRLVVANEPHRLVEVEAYYHSEDHPDIFAHRDPIQLECGKWYFHRTRGVYRSGSFKGL